MASGNFQQEYILRIWRENHRVHRVAMATIWRTFHHDGKIRPAWWVWGVHPRPLSRIYHHVQSCSVRSSWEGRRYTPPISTLLLYELCGESKQPSSGLIIERLIHEFLLKKLWSVYFFPKFWIICICDDLHCGRDFLCISAANYSRISVLCIIHHL